MYDVLYHDNCGTGRQDDELFYRRLSSPRMRGSLRLNVRDPPDKPGDDNQGN